MDLLKPQQIFAQRYRIERFLAQGGMGAVFVGEHITTDQRVAVKVLWPHVLHSTDAVEKFQLEAKVAGRVQSDHIVRVIDAGFDEETKMPYLVMELLQGRTLDSLVVERGPLAPAAVVQYVRQVASGLDKAHGYVDKDGVQRPIVHRDLKPENLFLTQRDSGEPLVKILDFGIAKVVSEGTKVSREVKGTPLFMAFEQASGGRITPQTDIWALGLIVYWLLSGQHYWRAAAQEDAGITQLFGEVIAMPIAPPSERIRESGAQPPWPPSFDAWFLRCVDRDPEKRFRTAGQASAALAEVFPAQRTSVAPSSTALSAQSIAATSLSPQGVQAITGASSSGGSIGNAVGGGVATRPAAMLADSAAALSHTTNGQPKKTGSGAIVAAVAGVGVLLVAGVVGTFLFVRKGTPTAAVQPETTAQASAAPAAPTTHVDPQPTAVVAPATPPPAAPASAPPVPSTSVAPSHAPPVPGPLPKAKPGTKPDAAPPPAAPPPAAPPPKKNDAYGDR